MERNGFATSFWMSGEAVVDDEMAIDHPQVEVDQVTAWMIWVLSKVVWIEHYHRLTQCGARGPVSTQSLNYECQGLVVSGMLLTEHVGERGLYPQSVCLFMQ